jgi:hypothetical protein
MLRDHMNMPPLGNSDTHNFSTTVSENSREYTNGEVSQEVSFNEMNFPHFTPKPVKKPKKSSKKHISVEENVEMTSAATNGVQISFNVQNEHSKVSTE